ncbi:hypothetical protein ES705_32511 [subsurface metagenome]
MVIVGQQSCECCLLWVQHSLTVTAPINDDDGQGNKSRQILFVLVHQRLFMCGCSVLIPSVIQYF